MRPALFVLLADIRFRNPGSNRRKVQKTAYVLELTLQISSKMHKVTVEAVSVSPLFILPPVTDSTISPSVSFIAVSNLIKQFGRFAALRGVTAEFSPGKFHIILGDNGAGKTTLLRALAGLAFPTRGGVSRD